MRILAVVLALAASPVFAVGTDEAPGASTADAQAAVDSGDFAGALALLELILTDEPDSTDALNLAAYSHRNMGDLDQAATLYQAALASDPEHLGALEYQGELFVMQGDTAGAEANLARLVELCGSCEEHADLAEALAGS